MTGDSMRRVVRDATREDHRRLDQAMSNFALDDRVGYGLFLDVHYTALKALAGRWRDGDQPDFAALLLCLAEDLKALGHPAPHPAAAARAEADPLRQWGIAYVIRGSRLGAQVLRPRVPADLPATYLEYVLKLSWPDFLQQLDEAAGLCPGRSEQIIHGARSAFGAFIAAVGESSGPA